jgi:hypothetical protein
MPRGPHTTHTLRRGGPAGPAPGGAAVAAGFCSEADFAARHGLSRGAVIAGIQRGEIACTRVGSRVLVCSAVFDLRAIGLDDPARLGACLAGAGIRDLAGLLRFLSGDGDGEQ